jgi:hypothetical protein
MSRTLSVALQNNCKVSYAIRKPTTPKVSIGTRYQLTKEETQKCISLGTERNTKNQEQKRTNRRYCGRDDAAISIQGIVGELAFQKMSSGTCDIEDTHCRSVMDETDFDCVLSDGKKIDVKTTFSFVQELRVTTWKKTNPPDAYALLVLTNYANQHAPITFEVPPCLEFCGIVPSRTLFQDKNIKSVGTTDYYVFPRSMLQPLN